MRFTPNSKRGSFILFAFTLIFICFSVQSVNARQSERPFSLDLNFGGGLIGNSGTGTAFQPELGFSYMPGRWGVGINTGLYHFDSGFNTDQYRAGFEEYTVSEQNEDRWRSYFFNAGPRFEQSLSRVVSMKLGLDLAMNYQEGPSQSVRFNDPTGEMENAGFDTNIVLADMNGSADAGWSAAIRPQLQLEFSPGFSERFSFNIRTGIQHHLSDREITYSTRDLSEVRPMDNVYEMHFQFDNAPMVQRAETAPKTNFFANAGIKIRFGKSSRGLHPEGVIHRDVAARNSAAPAQDYNAARSNKPTSRASDIGDGDMDSDDDGIDDAVEMAQDYNSSRSNKPNTNRIADGGNGQILREAIRMAMMVNPAGTVMSAGQVLTSIKSENPLHQEETREGENPLYEGQANDDGNSDNGGSNHNVYPSPVQQYDIRPVSYCVSLSTMQISTNSQKAMRSGAQSHNSSRSNRTEGIANPDLDTGDIDSDSDSTMITAIDAQSHNSSRSNRTEGVANPDLDTGDTSGQESARAIPPAIHGIAVDDPTNLKPDTDQNGFPEIMKSASISISKRSARTGRSQSPIYEGETTNGTNPLYQSRDEAAVNDEDSDDDGIDDADSILFVLEIDPIDPDDDGDGFEDAFESATYSISEVKKEIETMEWMEGDADSRDSQENPLAQESGWNETPQLEVAPPNNVYQWTYNLSSIAGNEEIPANGTLTVLFTGGAWHFDVHLDPDDDGDGFGDLLQNSSFSIREKGLLSNE